MTAGLSSRFWDRYINKTIAYNIAEPSRRWYVKRAEDYIKTYSDLPLARHLASHVEDYLKDLGRRQRLSDWQFRQAVEAIRILFTDVVRVDWAAAFPWQYWMDAATSLPNGHATVARDYTSLPGQDTEALTSTNTSDEQQAHIKDTGLTAKVSALYPEHFSRLISTIRVKQYAIRTEQSYASWLARFIAFHKMRDPAALNGSAVRDFLEYLVVKRNVAGKTQNQALCALIFYYRHVLEVELGELGSFLHAKKPRRLPVVLSRSEVHQLLSHITDKRYLLIVNLLYGCGLRLMECMRLRVFDIDFTYKQIIVRQSKGGKDRVTPLPKRLVEPLHEQIAFVIQQHQEDLTAGYGEVYLPSALSRKYPNAARQPGWQYVFPASKLAVDPRSDKVRRHHIHESAVQKQITQAVKSAGIIKRATSHSKCRLVNCYTVILAYYQLTRRIECSFSFMPVPIATSQGFPPYKLH